nr:MAG TPA: hypothetical protein [Caudoviricetes sp.]
MSCPFVFIFRIFIFIENFIILFHYITCFLGGYYYEFTI